MSLKVCVLGSGSTGNCIFVASENTVALVDLGLPPARVEKCLKALESGADGVNVLVTHCHSDHVSGLAAFVRRHPSTDVYCHADCLCTIRGKIGGAGIELRDRSADFFAGDLTVSPFRVSHDVPCVGYRIYSGGRSVTIATDLGAISDEELAPLADTDLVVLECNHDERLLMDNPGYPPRLKKRILSPCGHLSNSACADHVAFLARLGVKRFILAHLSRENNYPELAFDTVSRRLAEEGISGVSLEIACPDRMSGLYEIT